MVPPEPEPDRPGIHPDDARSFAEAAAFRAGFDGATGRGVLVAVVDSGVGQHSHLMGPVEDGLGLIRESDGSVHEIPDFVDRIGHGTCITAVIRLLAPETKILPIRVFHDRIDRTWSSVLARAIEVAAERGARVINLSLGTTNLEHRDLLAGACARAREAGATIVASGGLLVRSARGIPDGPPPPPHHLPAALPDVIGVVADADLPRPRIEAMPGAATPYEVRAHAFPRALAGRPQPANFQGPSCAVPHVTAAVALMLEREPDATKDRLVAAIVERTVGDRQ